MKRNPSEFYRELEEDLEKSIKRFKNKQTPKKEKEELLTKIRNLQNELGLASSWRYNGEGVWS